MTAGDPRMLGSLDLALVWSPAVPSALLQAAGKPRCSCCSVGR